MFCSSLFSLSLSSLLPTLPLGPPLAGKLQTRKNNRRNHQKMNDYLWTDSSTRINWGESKDWLVHASLHLLQARPFTLLGRSTANTPPDMLNNMLLFLKEPFFLLVPVFCSPAALLVLCLGAPLARFFCPLTVP
ncbi:MAG: hypothetical protein J3Q66DRAFT_331701 [Benniella sp.]|nr:MAG: hypothetical protein J3Q66DRAFT_331701 [Benniella sp.]